MELSLYQATRENMLADPKWSSEFNWSEAVSRPDSPDDLARELIWVIANSGMKNTVARGIFNRVMEALKASAHPSTVFGHVGKASAMNTIWNDRDRLFREVASLSDAALVEWCGRLPHIGKITRYHAAKNLGASVAKPDRWLERVAALSGETVDGLCERLSTASGDRISTVDLVIWWAMAYKLLTIVDGNLVLSNEKGIHARQDRVLGGER